MKAIFQKCCAQVEGEPCCDWVGACCRRPLPRRSHGHSFAKPTAKRAQVGEQGAGHYVKMVHNGIEYGDMQIICEAYHLMKVRCAPLNSPRGMHTLPIRP